MLRENFDVVELKPFRILAFFPQFQDLNFCFEGFLSFFNFLHLDNFLCLQVQVVTDFLFTKVIKAMAEVDIGCACFESCHLICLNTRSPTEAAVLLQQARADGRSLAVCSNKVPLQFQSNQIFF